MLHNVQSNYIKSEGLEDFQSDRLVLNLFETKRSQHANHWKKEIFLHDISMGGLAGDVALSKFQEILANVQMNILVVHEDAKEFGEPYEPTALYLVAHNDEFITVIHSAKQYFALKTWSGNLDAARTVNRKIFAQLPQETKEENTVSFKFWKLGPQNHAFPSDKDLVCPKFEQIRDNYTQSVVEQFEALTALSKPDEYGRIILWHGPPGNGKTYLIRALSREWAKTHEVTPEVIIDPESFFSNSYYLDTLLTTGGDSDTFRLVIIEDYANIIAAGCRNSPGFSRLLNTTDGLLGQGQRLIFLLTANEPLDIIDPAILRPGRCLHRMELTSMTADEGRLWLKKKEVEHLVPKLDGLKEVSLADLYALLHGNPFVKEPGESIKGSFGFGQ